MTHDNVTDIVGRLRKVEGGAPDSIGISTCWYRNPDGPEAADIIKAQQADLATLRKQLENARSEALEEAAEVAGTTTLGYGSMHTASNIIKAIRALKGQPC